MIRSRYVNFTYTGFENYPLDSNSVWLYIHILKAFILSKFAERSIIVVTFLVRDFSVNGQLSLSLDFVFSHRHTFSDPSYFRFLPMRTPSLIDKIFLDHPSFKTVSLYPGVIPVISTYSKSDLLRLKSLHNI
jgi:hypothetical protein